MLKHLSAPYREFTMYTTLSPTALSSGIIGACPRYGSWKGLGLELKRWVCLGAPPDFLLTGEAPLTLIPISASRDLAARVVLEAAPEDDRTKLCVSIRPMKGIRCLMLFVSLANIAFFTLFACIAPWRWELMLILTLIPFSLFILELDRVIKVARSADEETALRNMVCKLETECNNSPREETPC